MLQVRKIIKTYIKIKYNPALDLQVSVYMYNLSININMYI